MTERDIEARAAAREAALRESIPKQRRQATRECYVFDKSQEKFWDIEDFTLNGEIAVNASIPLSNWRVEVTEPPPREPGARGRPAQRRETLVKPSFDIMRVENDQFVEGSTWWPGMPSLIQDMFIDGDGYREAIGRRIFNMYRPVPIMSVGKAELAGPWIDHIRKVWPEESEHSYFFDFAAHMVQRPDEKCHAAVVMSGQQGIGKDSALEPVRVAVGTWNAKDIEPNQIFSDFKPWLQTLLLVINEAKPADTEFSSISLYNSIKPWAASPPQSLPVNDKNVKLRHIVNLLRVVITTNNWLDLYIPPDDRRMFIMHSHLAKGWHLKSDPTYFDRLWDWIQHEDGYAHVAAWLRERDLSNFKPKREPPRTSNWLALASTWKEPEDGIEHALEKLEHPTVIFGSELLDPLFDHHDDVKSMIRNPRKLARRMSRAGYQMVAPDGERFVFTAAHGAVFRSRMAFIRNDIGLTDVQAKEKINMHGMAIAARIKLLKGAAEAAAEKGAF